MATAQMLNKANAAVVFTLPFLIYFSANDDTENFEQVRVINCNGGSIISQ